jgi:predicted nucleic acid-binding protein
VVIVLDTSFIYALSDRQDVRHHEAMSWYREDESDLVTTPLVLAEADFLIGDRLGRRAQASYWDDVARGAYLVEWWTSAAMEAAGLAQQWADLGLGMTDASLVALAERHDTLDLATFDHRHFRAVRSAGGMPFRLLPTDV